MTCAAVKFGIQKPKVLAFPHTGCLSNPQVPKTEILFYCMHCHGITTLKNMSSVKIKTENFKYHNVIQFCDSRTLILTVYLVVVAFINVSGCLLYAS